MTLTIPDDGQRGLGSEPCLHHQRFLSGPKDAECEIDVVSGECWINLCVAGESCHHAQEKPAALSPRTS